MSNDTTYTVYRIVCFVTGKCYIGQTLDHKRRMLEHFASLKRKKHHSRKLQFAFDKYGQHSFYFEVLEANIPSDKSTDREKYWIEQYDAFNNGYNCHEGGNLGGIGAKSIIWNGVEYPSMNAAARALGINGTTMNERIQNGYTCDDDMKGVSKPCEWNGVIFNSIKEAAIANNINPYTLYDRIKAGYKNGNDVQEHQKPCAWNGVDYATIKEAAKAIGITLSGMCDRLKRGYTCDDDMKWRKKGVVWNKISYTTQREAALANGFSENTLANYLIRGYTCNEDVPHENALRALPKPCIYNGVEYPSISAAARANDMTREQMRDKLKRTKHT